MTAAADRLFEFLLTAPPGVAACETPTLWWQQHGHCRKQWVRPIQLAIAAGYSADRLGWAFASAYQAALRVLVPDLPEDRVSALCVTEADGTAPRAMQTCLSDGAGGLRLEGAKRWTTLGAGSGLFLVAARDDRVHGDRPAIRLVKIPAEASGVQVEPMPPTAFVPEVPHARLRFDGVAVSEAAVLPGDGWSRYVKPFRSIEDLHVQAAALAYLVRESRRLAWPRDWTGRALAVLASCLTLAGLDPSGPSVQVVLGGVLDDAERLVKEADGFWAQSSDPEAAARWRRDVPLLAIATGARAARLAKAWERFAEA